MKDPFVILSNGKYEDEEEFTKEFEEDEEKYFHEGDLELEEEEDYYYEIGELVEEVKILLKKIQKLCDEKRMRI